MHDIIVNVTERDIAEGCCRGAQNCPIARAVVRALGDSFNDGAIISVCGNISEFQENDQNYPSRNWDMPIEASQFVADFDAGNPVVPFSFVATARQPDPKWLRDE